MEAISKISTTQGRPAEISSQTDHIAKPIPVEKQRAMGDVLDRWRLNNGWNPLDDKTQMASIASYIHELDSERVPYQCYSELYSRAIKSRITAIQQGKQLPNFGVELLLAEWLGPHGLKKELKQREIETGRTLTGFAESQCPKCSGTGMERVKDALGRVSVRPGCQHEYVEPEEATMNFEVFDRKRPAQPETAVQIIARLRRSAARDFVTAEHEPDKADAAWSAQKTLMHAEKYVREVESV